ncbi:MFS transporter [Catellatospora coxensis]
MLNRRHGPKLPLFLGAALVTAAYALPAVVHDQLWHLVASGVLTGAGMGLAFAAMSNAIIASVPATHTGEATSVNSIVRTIGGSIGTAVVAAVIAGNTTPRGLPTDQAFTSGFWVCAGVAALAVVASLILPSARSRRAGQVAAGADAAPGEVAERLTSAGVR